MTFLRRPSAAALLTAGALILPARTTLAAAPALRVTCPAPNALHVVICKVSGTGFTPSERVHVSYRVTFLAMPAVNGYRPTETLGQDSRTNESGRLVRAPLRFHVVPDRESFHLRVDVTGSHGDHARTTFTKPKR